MDQTRSRLDGWKSIAGYFKRDRTTVMRWASERDLPIHRLPGGKQNSVYAYEDELVAWSTIDTPVTSAEDCASDLQEARTLLSGWTTNKWLASALGLLALLCVPLALYAIADGKHADASGLPEMPDDPQATADYVEARNLWARRTPEDLKGSIALYEKVIDREPDFAPAYAGLADAWLLYREYGDLGEAEAYAIASEAADNALSRDPDLASAHRAKGFIEYWWHYDSNRALSSFNTALKLDKNDGLTHFWYANVLSDIGDHKGAQRAYDIAQLLLPGTPAIEIERACALWQAGEDRESITALEALARKYPADATVHNCLAWAKIGIGDIVGYTTELRIMADLRKEPDLIQLARTMDNAIKVDPDTAHLSLIADARRELAAGERQTRMTPAFYASAMGDRDSLLDLLSEAANVGEKWQSVNLITRIADKWEGDQQIAALITRLRTEPHTEARQ